VASGPVTNKFVYDGWNLIAEVDGGNNILRSYSWGQDLSGDLESAGGIGGLWFIQDHIPVTDTYHFLAYDGNGNITGIINATDQSVSARYEYSPFGELIRASGPLAQANPFRFSTKYWDQESDLVYYGFRYYSPSLGRWINRDPIGEAGGLNLYSFIGNNAITGGDLMGYKKIHFDSKSLHVHDKIGQYEVSYGIRKGDDGTPILVNLGGKHSKEFNLSRAKQSFQSILADPNGLEELRKFNASNFAGYPDASRKTGQALRNLKKLGKAAGAAAGLMAIVSATSSSAHAAETASSYGKGIRSGEIGGYVDLDAISISMDAQEATGNYFIMYEVLDILLQ